MNLDALTAAGLSFVRHARLADYTTFRLGGECDALISCDTADDLSHAIRACHAAQLPCRLLGGGSNILAADEGVPGVVIRYSSEHTPARFQDGCITIPAAAPADYLSRAAAEGGVDGFGFTAGIPGTIGGAIAGNAGAFGEQIADRLESIEVVNAAGAIQQVARKELHFSYRSSDIPRRGLAITRATLRGSPGAKSALEERRLEMLRLRGEKHPDWKTTPTAGSFFRNIEPTSAASRRQAAGWFLEQAGAQACRVGAARVFHKHSNILICEGAGATARDVAELSLWLAASVRQRFGIHLQREVQFWGQVI